MTRRFLTMVMAAALALAIVGAPPAQAYIDPGSTNFILQIILGAVFGAGLAIATFWRRLKGFFGRLFGRGDGSS